MNNNHVTKNRHLLRATNLFFFPLLYYDLILYRSLNWINYSILCGVHTRMSPPIPNMVWKKATIQRDVYFYRYLQRARTFIDFLLRERFTWANRFLQFLSTYHLGESTQIWQRCRMNCKSDFIIKRYDIILSSDTIFTKFSQFFLRKIYFLNSKFARFSFSTFLKIFCSILIIYYYDTAVA